MVESLDLPTNKGINMKHFLIGKLWLLALAFSLGGILRAAPESEQEEKVDAGNYQAVHARALAEFKAARFGMFIHWGLYSMPARGEWEMQVHRIPSTFMRSTCLSSIRRSGTPNELWRSLNMQG
jgi:hypothetical protein